MSILSVFIGQKCCVHTCKYHRFVHMRNTCMYMYIIPDVEFTVSKIVLYEILIMLGIKFITKTKLLTWL